MSTPTTVAQFKTRCPGFFSKFNKKFFGDQSYSVYKEFFIVQRTKALSPGCGSYTSHVAYRWSEKDQDVNWVAECNNRPLLKMKLNEILRYGVRSEYDLPKAKE